VSLTYVLRRLLQLVPIALGVTILVFFLIHLVPGDPARTILGNQATTQRGRALHHEWGLDQPLPGAVRKFMERLAARRPRRRRCSTTSRAAPRVERLPVTLWLIASARLLSVLIAVPLALLAATRATGPTTSSARAARRPRLPALLARDHAAARLRRCTSGGCSRSAATANGFLGHLHSMFLPALTVALGDRADPDPQPAREPARGARVGLRHDRALEGLPERRVLVRHALRNASSRRSRCSASTSATWSAARS
jgi:peptide/nickel transport system permease protein